MPERTAARRDYAGAMAAPDAEHAHPGLSRAVDDAPSPALRAAVAHLDAPFGVLDLDAFDANLDALADRAGGVPIRVASKSLRCLSALERALAHPGYRGVLAFTLPEAIALAERGIDDLVVAYPSVHRAALERLCADTDAGADLRRRITLMVDDTVHVRSIGDAIGVCDAHDTPVRVAIDVDASYRPLERVLGDRLHLGVRRSPVHDARQAWHLARAIASTRGVRLVGAMLYEGQIAGVADGGRGLRGAAVRLMQSRSDRELRDRRRRIVAAIETGATYGARNALRPGAPPHRLEFVNGGGTGSLERTSADPAVTEVSAGSGLYSPALFDHYRGFRHRPAAYVVLPVVRRPTSRIATMLGGGYLASGPPGVDRQPVVAWPRGLRTLAAEGFGEVQTPLRVTGAPDARGASPAPAIGSHVWLRHAKAGELAERIDRFVVVSGGRIVDEWPTYRGEGWTFL